MLFSVVALLVGCIHVPVYHDDPCPGCDSGTYEMEEPEAPEAPAEPPGLGPNYPSCASHTECGEFERCVLGECAFACVSDDECEGKYACTDPELEYTDELGCAQRCYSNADCKGGTTCGVDGACHAFN